MPKEERRISPAVAIIPIGLGLAAVAGIAALAWAAPPIVYTCPYCGAEFSTEAELLAHIESEHPEEPPVFICPYCGVTFTTQEELDAHIESEHPAPPGTGMITLYATGLRTFYWPGGVRMEGTPYEQYIPPGTYADWRAEWHYPPWRVNMEDYHWVRTQNDPCTPPEPIDLNNLLIKVHDDWSDEICPATGYGGACEWGPFGPFVVEDGGVYTINIRTGELIEGRV